MIYQQKLYCIPHALKAYPTTHPPVIPQDTLFCTTSCPGCVCTPALHYRERESIVKAVLKKSAKQLPPGETLLPLYPTSAWLCVVTTSSYCIGVCFWLWRDDGSVKKRSKR